MAATNHQQHVSDVRRDLEGARPSNHEAAGSESRYRIRSLLSTSSPPCENKVLLLLGKYVLFLVTIVAATAIIAALGVLTAPVSAVLLLVLLVTYSLTRPIHLLGISKMDRVIWRIMVGFTSVALFLFVPLIILFFVFRLVRGLEGEEIVGLEVWKWLAIGLVSCLFSIIWIGGSYFWANVQREHKQKENLVYFVNASRGAVNCLCFFAGELLVLKVAPGSKDMVVIHGLPIWKWIAVIVLIICACNLIRIATRLLTLLLDLYQQEVIIGTGTGAGTGTGTGTGTGAGTGRKYVVYMAKGLRQSINFFLLMVLILLTWAFYVNDHPDLDRTSEDAKTFLCYAKGTFLALFVGSVLWVIKNFLLLLWRARQVYKRLTDRMLKAWTQLYFIFLIFGTKEEANLLLIDWNICAQGITYDQVEQVKNTQGEHDGAVETDKAPSDSDSKRRDGSEDGGSTKNTEQDRKRRARKELVTYDILHRMSGYLVAAEELWTNKEEEEESADSILSKISKSGQGWKEQPAGADSEVLTREQVKGKIKELMEEQDKLSDTDLQLLYAHLAEVDQTRKDVRSGDLEKWLTRAYKNCLTVGSTLAGNEEIAVYLNKILTVAVGIAVPIVWLFLVKLTTIEFIAAVVSPLVAVAFVFGDTAKSLFEGMIFAFAIHPFDVGDICVINGNQRLEVRRLGIWKTVFLKQGCKDEQVIYPNSALVDATIVKHKSALDLSDYLEFYVSRATTEKIKEIKNLRDTIKSYLDENHMKFEKKSQVVVKEVDDKVKIGVSFIHLMSFQYMSYMECLDKKNENTSELWENILSFVNAYEEKVDTSNTNRKQSLA